MQNAFALLDRPLLEQRLILYSGQFARAGGAL